MPKTRRKVNIIGHRNPDTDSICSALAYTYLKNQLGDAVYEARRAGQINRETAFVLKHFGVEPPRLCTDVSPQVKDIDIREQPGIDKEMSIRAAWSMMRDTEIDTLCAIDEDKELLGLITVKDIANANMDLFDTEVLAKSKTSYKNVLSTLEGEMLLGDPDACITSGRIFIGTSPEIMDGAVNPGDIVLVSNRYEVQMCAIDCGAGAIVVCCGSAVPRTILARAQEKGCIVITTPFDTYAAARLISTAAPVRHFMRTKELLKFSVNTPIEDARKVMASVRHRYFPILDENGKYITTDKKFRKAFHSSQYNILVVANKYQTGFDEPLLHTMYVDKKLRDVTAVQTLSRLNRTTFGKNSTFVLDFESTEEDIKGAFLPYYETTTLEGSTDLNRVYDLRNKIRDFMLYNFEDVEAFNKFMATQASKEQDATALGRLAGMFRPVIARYMDLSEEDRYTVRDYVRKFNKAYAFVTQLVRLHDRDLFNEYQYTLHLIRLLPRIGNEDIGNIEDKIKLEYASLTETFRGAIVLDEKPPAFVPGGSTAPKAPNKKKDTLQSIIDKVNERFSGNFTDADRVIIEGIYQMFMRDSEVKKFRKYAKDNSTEMFVRSLFPDKFRDIVTQCFLDNNDSFAKLFNDPDFYQKVQEAMAQELYKALRKE